MLQLLTLIVFPAMMIFAALSDLFTMTISNRLSLALALVFLPFAYAAGLPLHEIGLHLLCGLGVLAFTFGLFAAGWVGGGDAKLAAATAVWLGWHHLADYGLISAIAGGLLTLCILGARNLPMPAWALDVTWLTRLHDRATGVPYGIALAAAGLLVYPDTMVWSAAAAA